MPLPGLKGGRQHGFMTIAIPVPPRSARHEAVPRQLGGSWQKRQGIAPQCELQARAPRHFQPMTEHPEPGYIRHGMHGRIFRKLRADFIERRHCCDHIRVIRRGELVLLEGSGVDPDADGLSQYEDVAGLGVAIPA